MIVQENNIPSLSTSHPAVTTKLWKLLENLVASVSLSNVDDSDWFLSVSGTYFEICYICRHVSSKRCHLKWHTHIIKALNRNYEATFGMKASHRRQTPILPVTPSHFRREDKDHQGRIVITRTTIDAACHMHQAMCIGWTIHIQPCQQTIRQILRLAWDLWLVTAAPS